MKKLSIYLIALLAAGLTSCNEDFNGNIASPQAYSPEEAASKIAFTATGVAPINLGQTTAERVTVSSFTAPAVPDATFTYKMKLDNKASVVVDAQGTVATEDLQNAVALVYGIRPIERTMQAVLTAYITLGETTYAASADMFELKVTPKAPVIEGAYFLEGGLTYDSKVVFGHAIPDPYVDGGEVFSITVPSLRNADGTAKNAEFFISSLSGKKMGPTDQSATEGSLVVADNVSNFKIDGGNYKAVKVTINMLEGTYAIEKIAQANYLWFPGDYQGWAPEKSATLVTKEGNEAFWGLADLNGGGFKFTPGPSWDNAYGYNYFTDRVGEFTTDGDNMILPAGQYYLIVNPTSKYVSATKVNFISIIGSVKGSWDTDVDLIYNTAGKYWEATADLTAGEFKLRLNHLWEISWGGTISAPSTFESGNMKIEQAGNYTARFYVNNRFILIKNNQ